MSSQQKAQEKLLDRLLAIDFAKRYYALYETQRGAGVGNFKASSSLVEKFCRRAASISATAPKRSSFALLNRRQQGICS